MHSRILLLPDAKATEDLGRALASTLSGGMVITLAGQLGAGKTTLVRGVLRGLDIRGAVKSPTYTLVEPYAISSLYLYHFDFYRLGDPDEWEAAGFREYFRDDAICMIEWPEKAGPALPRPDLAISLEIAELPAMSAPSAPSVFPSPAAAETPPQHIETLQREAGRRCTLSALTERAERCLAAADRFSTRNAPAQAVKP
jgi:tRNA threonylcarbamoyladenosine biosynthesis protein TsaE